MQHERINVAAELRDDEGHALSHQARDEVHIAAQTIQLGHGDMSAKLLGLTKGSGELWALVKRAATLAGLDLDKLAGQGVGFRRREARWTAARWASRPSPDLPWRPVETR